MSASFAPVTLDEWRDKVGERAAAGVPVTPTPDGIDVPWLFVAEDLPAPDPAGTPGQAPFIRGVAAATAWDVRQEARLPDRAAAHRAILADLEGGATSVALVVASDGVDVRGLDDLDALLDGVLLDLAPVALHAGARGIEVAELLLALWRRRGHDLSSVGGALGLDPLGALAASGELPAGGVAETAAWCEAADGTLGSAITVLGADTAPYAAAGASAAQELAVAVATAAEHLRAGEAAGLSPTQVAARLEFTLQGDADQFTGIAKLRALRRMWARVLEACDVPAERRRSRIASRTSDRMLAAVDPWVNILRATTAAFAAAVGGADTITVSPLDLPRGAGSELGRRIARNTQHVLADESHLARVGDPGGGSWYVEWLTDRLAEEAWSALQAIEAGGGMLAGLRNGTIATTIAAAAARRADDIRHRRIVLTGVNAFPLLGADGLEETEPAAHAAAPAPGALAPVRDSLAFEQLRERAQRAAAPPRILVACVGPIARHNAVATWARSFFEVGGIVAVQTAPLADGAAAAGAAEDTGAPLAVVCASEEEPALLRDVTGALRDAGARRVYLARSDDAHAVECGADQGVDDGIDMIDVLTDALDLCGA